MKSGLHRTAGILALAGTIACLAIALATRAAMQPPPEQLPGTAAGEATRPRVLDREGRILAVTYDNAWNLEDVVALHDVPAVLRDAFVFAEDGRFFEHHGVDWRARLGALAANLRAGRVVRGASTITEQTVRMLHPRARTLWSRWVEGFEARALERRFSKGEILEFYLNQVPYAARRRGVAQAARTYFDRDLDTLDLHEVLLLAVLPRGPSRLDPLHHPHAADRAVRTLAARMAAAGRLDGRTPGEIVAQPLVIGGATLDVRAPHFVAEVRARLEAAGLGPARVRTTLDASLQQRVEAALESQLRVLAPRGAGDGAVLVVNNTDGAVLAWVNAGGYDANAPGSCIDAVLTPRQPGSTLKPFVYAAAMQRGWTAATLVDDAPLQVPVGRGLHRYRNYSGTFHGPLRLREALGNSLNIPAVRALRFVGVEPFLELLHNLGFDNLHRGPAFYGEGLALGDGEVSLYALVGAYATIARGGEWRSLRVVADPPLPAPPPRRVLDPAIARLIANILADPRARTLEFGRGGVLELPVPTAVKTGTSNDYRDAWAVGFSARHTVGVWIGNLDRDTMRDVTGSIGPALVLRGVFAELRRAGDVAALPMDRDLRAIEICRDTGVAASPLCPRTVEWFAPGTQPIARCPLHDPPKNPAPRPPKAAATVRLVRPTPGLNLALDPRIPDELERFTFELDAPADVNSVTWYVDGEIAAETGPGEHRWQWPLVRGTHEVWARVDPGEGVPAVETARVAFAVK